MVCAEFSCDEPDSKAGRINTPRDRTGWTTLEIVEGVVVVGASVAVVDGVVVDDVVVVGAATTGAAPPPLDVGAAVVVGAEVVDVDDDVVGATVVVVDVVVDVVVVVVDSETLTVRPEPKATTANASPIVPAAEPARVAESDPRRPCMPLPQHFSDASSRTAHVC